MNSKINKVDLIIQIIIAAIILGIAYVIGYPSGKRLMVIGVVVIIFGFWWKWSVYWNLKASSYIEEQMVIFEKKIEKNESLNLKEKIFKFYKSYDMVQKLCLYIGVILILTGYLILLIKG